MTEPWCAHTVVNLNREHELHNCVMRLTTLSAAEDKAINLHFQDLRLEGGSRLLQAFRGSFLPLQSVANERPYRPLA